MGTVTGSISVPAAGGYTATGAASVVNSTTDLLQITVNHGSSANETCLITYYFSDSTTGSSSVGFPGGGTQTYNIANLGVQPGQVVSGKTLVSAKYYLSGDPLGATYGFIQWAASVPVDRKITLTYTNPSSGSPDLVSSWIWAGWGKTGTTWVQQLRYVAPGATETWYVSSPVGDTNSYEVKTISTAAWEAQGPVQLKYPIGSPQDLAGENMMDMGAGAHSEGTPKTYADGVDGTSGATGTVTPPSTVANPSGPSSATPSLPPGASSPLSPSQSVTPPLPSSAPTQQTQADGTNAILNAINGLKGAVQQNTAVTAAAGGTGGSGTDMSGVESRLDTANAHLNAIETATEALRTKQDYDDEKDAATTTAGTKASDGVSAGTSAGTAATGIVNSKGGSAPSGLGYTPSEGDSGYASSLIVSFPAAFGGASVNLNPFSNSGMMTVAHWFRSACAWLAYALLGVFIWKEMSEWIRGASAARQATGNTVFAGTGAQATALTNAVLITAAAVVLFTAAMAWSLDSISFSFLRTNALTNPLAGMPAVALGMLCEVLPVATLISCLIARFTFNFYASALFATYSAVVRFFIA